MDATDWVLVLLACLCLFAVLMGGIFLLDEKSCDAQVIDMGFPHRWSILSGCMIEVQQGKWIPLSSYYYKEQK